MKMDKSDITLSFAVFHSFSQFVVAEVSDWGFLSQLKTSWWKSNMIMISPWTLLAQIPNLENCSTVQPWQGYA